MGSHTKIYAATFAGTIPLIAGSTDVLIDIGQKGGVSTPPYSGTFPNGGFGGSNGAYKGGGATQLTIGTTRHLVAGAGGGYSGVNTSQFVASDGVNPDGAGSNQSDRNCGGGGGGFRGGMVWYNTTGYNEKCAHGGRGSSYVDPTFASSTHAAFGGDGTGENNSYETLYQSPSDTNGELILTFTPTSSSVSQQPSSGTVGVALGTQPAVTLLTGGTAAPGVTVTAVLGTSPTPTGTQIPPVLDGTSTATTDALGVATFSGLSIRGPAGNYTLTFTATGYPSATSSTFALAEGAASALAVTTQPTGGTSGGTVTGSPAVTVIDVGGNPITTDSTTSITASSTTGTIGGTTTVTASSGVATFNALTLAGTAGNHTLTFSADGLTPVTSSQFAITHGVAAALAVTTQPVGSVAIGSPLSVQPVVRVVDAQGNTVTSDSGTTITATVATGDGNASLANATASTSAGEATFAGLTVNGAGGDITLTFSATGLTSVDSSTFSINRTAQTIAFTHSGTHTYGDDPFSVSASADSGLTVSFTSSTPAVCTVSGTTVTILAAGDCTIDADQAGNGTYAPATQQSVTISVAKAAQAALTFTNSDTVAYGDALLLSATGGSGTGALSYALSGGAGSADCSIATLGVASVSPSAITTLTHTSLGTCDITVTKAGDDNHQSETSSPLTITVTKAPQTLSFTSSVPASPQPGGTYAVTATSDRGLTPTLTITTGSPSVCTLSSGTVTFVTTGSCVVTATQAGDSNHSAATPITQTITISNPPAPSTPSTPGDTDDVDGDGDGNGDGEEVCLTCAMAPAPPLPGTDADGDGEIDGWTGRPGSGGGGGGGEGGGGSGAGGGGGTTSPTSPCSGCVSVFPAPAPGAPVPTFDSSDPGVVPGGVTVSTPGGATGTVGTRPGSGSTPPAGSAEVSVDEDGSLNIDLPGTVPVSGGGALPGTTVTVYVDGVPVGTTTVDANGNYALDVTLPTGIESGLHVIRVDFTDLNGDPSTILFGATVNGGTPPTLPITGPSNLGIAWALLIAALGGLMVITGRGRREPEVRVR